MAAMSDDQPPGEYLIVRFVHYLSHQLTLPLLAKVNCLVARPILWRSRTRMSIVDKSFVNELRIVPDASS